MRDYYIVIVGGSVAGLNCAYYAAREWGDVIVVERKKEIGIPVQCAEAIPWKVFEDNKIRPQRKFIATKIKKVKMVTPKGKVLRLNLKHEKGAILHRDLFEKHLAARAVKEGARMMLGVGVKTVVGHKVALTNGQVIRGEVIIGADGYDSLVGREAGIYDAPGPRDRALCIQHYVEDIDIGPGEIEVYWGWNRLPGYVWVFSKGEGKANVGIGLLDLYGGKALRSMLSAFMRHRFLGASWYRIPNYTIVGTTGGIVPLARPLPKLWKDHIILIGDAGNLAFAHHGGGIGNAMLSGQYAGRFPVGQYYQTYMKHLLYDKLERCYRLKEKVMVHPDKAEWYFRYARLFLGLHRIAPKQVEKRAMRNLRY